MHYPHWLTVVADVIHWLVFWAGVFILFYGIDKAGHCWDMGRKSAAVWRITWTILLASLLIASVTLDANADDRVRTDRECNQAADMLVRVATGRDHGLTQGEVMLAFAQDLQLAKRYKPSARWFVEEEADAQFLYRWLIRVYEAEETPEHIRFESTPECLGNRAVGS